MLARCPAKGPQGLLEPFGQGGEALAPEHDVRMAEARIRQPEVVQPVAERGSRGVKGVVRRAGNAIGGTASSRCAAPPLRCGPAGDTAPPMAKRSTMPGRGLPAIAGPAG